MVNFVVNGMWGARTESLQRIGERWAETFSGLDEIDDECLRGWREDAGPRSTSPELPSLSAPALAEYVERGNRDPDDPYIGYTESLETMKPNSPLVRLSIHAGGQSVWVTNSVALSFKSRVVDEDSVRAVRHGQEILRIIAEAWDIDGGQVYRRSEYNAVKEEFGLAAPDPRCGRAVYLSANRAALAPEGLPGIYTRTAHGGLIIDLTHGGTQDPGIETILDVNRKLRAAGALEPLATPYQRDKW